jgi:L,D-peptidoglycan transpeptidase YkuD (ErfK/YbiS/YcfS/YnhG family)
MTRTASISAHLTATVLTLLATLACLSHSSAAVPPSCRQLVVTVADTWDSSTGTMQLFNRVEKTWQPASEPMHVLLGKNGIAWGIGVAGQNEPGRRKVESDNRAPAGLFRLGKVFTYSDALPAGSNYPFHRVTTADAWIEDPAHPQYNRHVIVDPTNPPPWFKKQQMRQDDPAHRWKVEIRHNADPPAPGAGSAIFFHIQRGPNRPSAGCTTMPEASIFTLIRWLRQDANPHYVLLPKSEYLQRWKAWNLPPPSDLGI